MSVKRRFSMLTLLSGWKKLVASDISTIKDHTVHFQFIPKSTTKKGAQGGPWKVVTDGDGDGGMGMGMSTLRLLTLQPTFPISGNMDLELQ